MAAQGIECRKAFYQATINHSIRVEHPVVGTVFWSYHVAPTVAVQTPQGVVRMVIDPSLFAGPVTIEEWTAVMSCDKAVLEQTPDYVYQPGDGRDDDYRQTARLLEEARLMAEAQRLAAAEAAVQAVLADGLVPAEDDVEDDDDVERTA